MQEAEFVMVFANGELVQQLDTRQEQIQRELDLTEKLSPEQKKHIRKQICREGASEK